MKLQLALVSTSLLLSFYAHAADTKAAQSQPKDLVNTFRCEKFSGSLGELKLKMIETCDLDRNFSNSMTRTVGGEEIYMFCCHKAK